MQMTPRTLLAADRRFNTQVHALKDRLWGHVDRVQSNLRTSAPGVQHIDRIGDAMALNAVWGFKQGAQWSLLLAATGGTPQLPYSMHAWHLPTRLGGALGVAGLACVMQALVGHRAPVSAHLTRDSAQARVETFFSIGLAGLASASLENKAAQITTRKPKIAQACLWGAALINVVSSAVRVVLYAVLTAIAMGIGLTLAATASLVGGVLQSTEPQKRELVDIGQMLRALFTPSPGASAAR